MKLVDLTEFYSQRGGGVRSHLAGKGHVSCQAGHDHWVVAPGPEITEERVLAGSLSVANSGPHVSSILHVGGPPLPYDPTYHLFWRVARARRWVRRIRPDVLEVHSPYLAAITAMSVPRSDFGIRTFVWHADFIDTYLRGSLERAAGSVAPARAAARAVDVTLEPLWAWVRAIASACDATFAASRFQVDKLSAHGVVRVEYLPFGVERDVFHPGRRDEVLRAELLGGRAGPLVVAIGRFAVEKRWDVVLDGYERIALRHPNAKLILLGDGPERERMRARLGARADVAFAGFEKSREKLAATLASADLLIHACPFETFGLGVAEAIAAGVPAVLPDRGGAAEQTFGPSVVLYPALDPEALADAASALLSRPAAERRAQAIETASRVPSIEDHFHALFARYAELLAARRS